MPNKALENLKYYAEAERRFRDITNVILKQNLILTSKYISCRGVMSSGRHCIYTLL